jgi:hypothetical protein
MTLVFHCIDDCTVPMHLLQMLDHVFIETNTLEEPVKKPAQKKTRFMIKHKGVRGFFA